MSALPNVRMSVRDELSRAQGETSATHEPETPIRYEWEDADGRRRELTLRLTRNRDGDVAVNVNAGGALVLSPQSGNVVELRVRDIGWPR